VVLVTINYRLGSLGFLRLKEITGDRVPSTGSEGLLDQIAALRWVRDNIAFFGGDPDNVTVFGESAGAMSIGCLLAMPSTRGLFHKAILQSGSNTVKFLDEANQLSKSFVGLSGLNPDDVQALRSLSLQQLLTAQNDLSVKLKIKGSVMEPVVDGDILPEMPIEAVKHGSARNIAVLIGTNLEEAKFMAWMAPGMTKVDQAELVKRWQAELPPELVPDLVENCRKALANKGSASDPPDLAIALQTDRQFRIPALRLAEAHSNNNQPVYSYLFDWKSAVPGLGACHALDVGFVFGNLRPAFHCAGPEAEGLATKMQDAWLAFARTGDPSCESLGKWPRYSKRRETMVLGKECHVEEAPYDEERQAWEPIPNRYLG
jgi:para-nitrobenzyl esterase